MILLPPRSTLLPYTTLFRSVLIPGAAPGIAETLRLVLGWAWTYVIVAELIGSSSGIGHMITDSQALLNTGQIIFGIRSEEHTSELQSPCNIVCRLLLGKKYI